MRALVFGGIGLAVAAGDFQRRVLAHMAARRLRRARRLPAAGRPVLAVPDVSVLSRLQRRGDGAVDVLSVRRSAAAAGGADRAARGCFTRASCARSAQSSWMVVVFLAPLLLGVGIARCAPYSFYASPC